MDKKEFSKVISVLNSAITNLEATRTLLANSSEINAKQLNSIGKTLRNEGHNLLDYGEMW
jgi:hypothetical protein